VNGGILAAFFTSCRKTYGTFRNDLIRMRTWFKQLKVTEIAMESTGVYAAWISTKTRSWFAFCRR
jgi:transposase